MTTHSENDPIPSALMETTNRREFLAFLAASVGAVLLSGCETATSISTPIPSTPTVLPPTVSPLGVAPTLQGLSIFRETIVEMAWPAIREAAQQGAIVLLPVGIIEEHGPHMGLGVDIVEACASARLIRQALEGKGVQALIAPPCYWGMSPETEKYPGTFSVRGSTMNAILYDIHASLRGWGFKYVISINNHGSSLHNRVFQETIQEANQQLGIGAYYLGSTSQTNNNAQYAIIPDRTPLPPGLSKYMDIHAGALETATMMIMFPGTVDTQMAKTLEPSSSFDPLGYWGSPANYDQIDLDELTRYAEACAEQAAQAIANLLKAKK